MEIKKLREVTSMIIMIAMLVGLFGITGYAQKDQVQEHQKIEQSKDIHKDNKEIYKEKLKKDEPSNNKEQHKQNKVDDKDNQVQHKKESQKQEELESLSKTLSTINIITDSTPVDIRDGRYIYYKGEKVYITIDARYVVLKKSAYKINEGSWCSFDDNINLEITDDAEITAKVFGKLFEFSDSKSYKFISAPAPNNLNLNTTCNSIDVSYNEVDRATGYKITVSHEGKVIKTKEVNSTTTVIDGLLPNKKYLVKVVPLIGNEIGMQTKKSCETKEEIKVYQLNITKNISEGGEYDILTPPNNSNGYTAGTIVEIRAYSYKGYSVNGLEVFNKENKLINSVDDYILKVNMDCDKNIVVNYKVEDEVYKMPFYSYNGSFAEQKGDVLGGSIDVDNYEYNANPGETIYLNFTLKSIGKGYGDATYDESNKLYDRLNEVYIGLDNTNQLLSTSPIYGIGYENKDIVKVEKLPITIPEDANGTYIYHFDMVDVYKGELAHITNSVEVTINVNAFVQNKTINIIKKIEDCEDENEIVGVGFGFGLLPKNTESEDLINKIYTNYDATLLDKLLRRSITDENGIVQFDNIPIGEYIVFELPNPLMGYFNPIDKLMYITADDFIDVVDITKEWINISHEELENALVNFKVEGKGIIKNEGIPVDKYIGDYNGPTNYYYYNSQIISLLGEASNGWTFDHWIIEEVESNEENQQILNGSFLEKSTTNPDSNLKNKQLEFNIGNLIKYNITAVFKENYIPPTPEPDPEPDPTYYKLTLECTEGGKILPSPGEKTYAWNTHVIMQIKPEDGYTFTGWEGDTDLLLSETRVVVKRNAKLKAIFEEKNTEPETKPEEEPEPDEESKPEPEPKPEQECIEEPSQEQEEEIEILDEQVPVDAPEQSPKTGGIPADILYGLGSLFLTSGLVVEYKRKKEK